MVAASMFLVSGIDLVAARRNGVIGSFPTANCRTPEQLLPQQVEGLGRQHHVPVLAALRLTAVIASTRISAMATLPTGGVQQVVSYQRYTGGDPTAVAQAANDPVQTSAAEDPTPR
jgi:hypothetical protein